jgi:hypothetical protein
MPADVKARSLSAKLYGRLNRKAVDHR